VYFKSIDTIVDENEIIIFLTIGPGLKNLKTVDLKNVF
jgi:hypothetical protein